MKRAGLIGGLVAALLVPAWGAAAGTEAQIAAHDARADLAAMYEGLQRAHYDLYAFTPKAAYDAAYARELARLAAPLSRFEFQRRLQRFAALARTGHARVDYLLPAWAEYRRSGGAGFPLTVRIVDGRAYVAEDLSGAAELEPGDEIVSLDGVPMAEQLRRVGANVSAETPYMAWSLIEYDLAPLLWAEYGPVQRFDLVTRRAGGAEVSLRIPARTAAELKASAAPPTADPTTREARVLPGRVGYLRPGVFMNTEARTGAEAWDTRAFTAFVDRAFADFRRAGVDRLLIDLRGNPGGDNAFSDPLVARFAARPFRFFSRFRVRVSPEAVAANAARLAADPAAAGEASRRYAELYAAAQPGEVVELDLPLVEPREDRFRGRVYLLVDRNTYSNAVNVAALVQDYGFGTVLGEETGDVATIHGAMERFSLPKTGLEVGFPKAFIVRPSGDLRSRGVLPDIEIRAPVVPGPRDRMLDEALTIVRRGAGRMGQR